MGTGEMNQLPAGTCIGGRYEILETIGQGGFGITYKADDKMLLLTKYAVDCQMYNPELTDVTWETCSLRRWLNEEFFGRAFDTNEQSMILNTVNIAEHNPYHDTYPGNDTEETVVLLRGEKVDGHIQVDLDIEELEDKSGISF